VYESVIGKFGILHHWSDIMVTHLHHLPSQYRVVFLALLAAPAISSAQVTYFKAPPTAQELQNILRSAEKPSEVGATRGLPSRGLEMNKQMDRRGIEWNSTAGSAQQTPIQPEPTPVAANPSTRPAASSSSSATGSSNAPAVAIPVNFNLGSSDIRPASMPFIDSIAAVMIQDPSVQLTVEGHTDASGDPKRNLMLSWERAFTVFRVLVTRYNIDPARLKPIGKGASEPIEGHAPTEDINRRVQFRVLG
jgi:OOP family OmpA-OmpF porin